MRHLKTLSICLSALALHSAAWAEIYETTDAQGNPNILTRDIGTSRIGQGSSAHTTLVDISRLES